MRDTRLAEWVAATAAVDEPSDIGWYGARGFHHVRGALVERVITVRASSRDNAIAAARADFLPHEDDRGGPCVGNIQLYAMPEPPGHGAEVFSVGRMPARRARSRILRTIMREAVLEEQRLIQVPDASTRTLSTVPVGVAQPNVGWYSARGFHHIFDALEERVFLIRASSRYNAIVVAREEFHLYEAQTGGPFEGSIQIYQMPAPPRHGAEVFSVSRAPARRARPRMVHTICCESIVHGRRFMQVQESDTCDREI